MIISDDLSISGQITFKTGADTTNGAPMLLQAGVLATGANIIAGKCEWDGTLLYVTQSSLSRKTFAFIGDYPYKKPVTQANASKTLGSGVAYVNDASSLAIYTLPATSNEGDVCKIIGSAASGWKIAQLAGQSIKLYTPSGIATTTTTGTSGSVASTDRYNTIEITCIITNTTFVVTAHEGVFTVV